MRGAVLAWLARRFALSTVRARSLYRAAVFHFVFVGTVTALKSATNALFLARRDPRLLPWLYLATAVVIAVVTAAIGRRLATSSARPILRTGLYASAAILAGLGILAAFDVRASLPVLYVAGESYATAISVLFWTRLSEVFDVRAQKRVFGLIAAAGMAGATVGGLGIRLLAVHVPSEVWCFVAAGSLVLIRPLLGSQRGPVNARKERGGGLTDGARYALSHPFPRGVALLVLFLSVQVATVDYAFRLGAHRFENGQEANLSGLFGVLNAVVGVLAIAFQSALTARLLRGLGVFAYLAIVPALCVLAAIAGLAWPAAFWPLLLLKTFEMMGSYSLQQPGLQLLYNPMPDAVRGSVRALIDGSVKKLGGALGGLGLIAIGAALGPAELLAVVIVLGALLLLWLRHLRPGYLDALEEKLGGRGSQRLPAIDPSERSTRLRLEAALAAGDAPKTLAAISILESERKFDFSKHLHALIAHPADAVRLKAIELVARDPHPEYAPDLVRVLNERGRHSKIAAARALMLVDPGLAERHLGPVLDAEGQDFGTLSAAIVGFFAARHAGARVAPDKVERVDRLLGGLVDEAKTQPPQARRDLVELLGLLGPGPEAARLGPFLDDPNPQVVLAAIAAAGEARHPSLPPGLIHKLKDRRYQSTAVRALARYGDEIVPALAEALDDRRNPLEIRVQIPKILQGIGTAKAGQTLLFSNIKDDASLRFVIIAAIGRMAHEHPGLAWDATRAIEAAVRRFRAYVHYQPIAADVRALVGRAEPAELPSGRASSGVEGPASIDGPLPPGADLRPEVRSALSLLARALEDRLAQNLSAGITLLALVSERDTLLAAARSVQSHGQRTRADVLEVIDLSLAGHPAREEILSYLEPRPRPGDPARAEGRLVELVEGRDILLATVAHACLHRWGRPAPEVREPTSGEPLMSQAILDKVFLLKDVQLFRGLSVDDLAAVAALTSDGHAEPRQTIYDEGREGDALFVLTGGEVHLLKSGHPLMELSPGDSFGQTSFLDGAARPVSARAGDEGADFVRLERRAFMDLISDRPSLLDGLFVELGARIRELIELSQGSGATSPNAPRIAVGRDTLRPRPEAKS